MQINKIKQVFESVKAEFSDNMITAKRRPHTPEVEMLDLCCPAPDTANYYFLARYFDKMDDDLAEGIVGELKKLQHTEKGHFYGCMRWYREETRIHDSNGAFFVLLPVALCYLFCTDKMTKKEKQDVIEMLERAGEWFSHECSGSLHYPNKITSDGAMLALISQITGMYTDECESFWRRWCDYVEKRGCGWGENTSDCYSFIILNAYCTALLAMKNIKIRASIEEKTTQLCDYIAFHGGKEFVPSIRTYNFSGSISYGGDLMKALDTTDGNDLRKITTAVVLYIAGITSEIYKNTPEEGVRNQRLFDNSYAYTWKGNGIRLGSVSEFPVMKGSYQQETYGLGWQSMPVSAMLENDYVAFLRLRTVIGDSQHSHPAMDKHSAYLYNRLFEDGNIPVYKTKSAQDKNIVVAVRNIGYLANTASAIYDEWCVPGSREVTEIEIGANKWYVLSEGEKSIALCPLSGICAEGVERKSLETKIMRENGFTTISTCIYSGEKKMLFNRYVENAWVIAAITESPCTDYLSKIKICDEELKELEVCRASQFKCRRIVCTDGESRAELTVDPYDISN